MANYNSDILFDVLKNIIFQKSEEIYQKHVSMEEFEKKFNRFMILRYLSMAKEDVANVILENQISLERFFPSNKMLYKTLLQKIPKQKSGFIKYLK